MTTTPPATDDETVPPPAPGWRIASLRGVPIYIGKSWPIVALVIVVSFAPSIGRALPHVGAGAYLVAAAYALLLLASVLAHEAGHALVAQGFGNRVDRIVADLWGGHTTYQATTNSPGRSALVAFAGPLMNALIAVVAWFLWPMTPLGVPSLLMGALFYSNAFVAVFNLLPGLPLDGGFLVDSAVWKITGSRTKGQLVAGWTGRLVTIAVIAWFVVLPLLRGEQPDLVSIMWMALIASFLWQGATAAIRGARLQDKVSAVDVRAVVRPVHLVPQHLSLAEAFGAQMAQDAVAVVADEGGRPIGFVSDAVEQIDPQAYATTPVSAVTIALPAGAVVDWRDDLTTTDSLQLMARTGSPAILVHDGRGTYGIVSAADIDDRISGR